MTKHTPPVEDHCFWVLMRTDLASMNAGKAVAQGTHAASQFESMIKNAKNEALKAGYSQWQQSGDHFGTTYTLGVDAAQMEEHVQRIKAELKDKVVAGIVFDPTYPVRDGAVTHFIPLNTCGFIFGPVSLVKPLTTTLELMP